MKSAGKNKPQHICPDCGGVMVEAPPVAIYCPNEACFEKSLQAAKESAKRWLEIRERQQLARLLEKYGDKP